MFHVRKCRPTDLESVSRLAESYTSFDTTPTLADVEGLYHKNPEYFLVAEDDSKTIIGFITGYERKGIPEEVLMTWKARKAAYIDLMAVDLVARKQGVGMTLLTILLDEFKRNGVDVVHLDVPAEGQAAIRLYEKSGFRKRAYNMRMRLSDTG